MSRKAGGTGPSPQTLPSLRCSVHKSVMLAESMIILYGATALTIALVLVSPVSGTAQINRAFNTFLTKLPVNSSTISNDVVYLCAGDIFGVGLSLQSCADANRRMERSSSVRTWGPRDERQYDVSLPKRWISCKYSTMGFRWSR